MDDSRRVDLRSHQLGSSDRAPFDSDGGTGPSSGHTAGPRRAEACGKRLKRLRTRNHSAKEARLWASNTAYLLGLQLANYVFPLLLVPFLTRRLGVAEFGVVAFGISSTQFAAVITDFGFNLSASARIARLREHRTRLSDAYSAVLLAKLPLASVVAAALLLLPAVKVSYRPYTGYFIWLSVAVFAQAFQSYWFFQGLEKLRLVAVYTIAAR